MNLLITGADQSLGQLAAVAFRDKHCLRLTGSGPLLSKNFSDSDYRIADLRVPEEVIPLVEGIDAILHLSIYNPIPLSGPDAEQESIDLAARGTYVLLSEARNTGVERVILGSTLALFDCYPEDYVMDETWQPQPSATVEGLVPYLSELTCREFSRAGELNIICLRFDPLDGLNGTSNENVVKALNYALDLEFTQPGYRWGLFHISSDNRFSSGVERGSLQIERRVD